MEVYIYRVLFFLGKVIYRELDFIRSKVINTWTGSNIVDGDGLFFIFLDKKINYVRLFLRKFYLEDGLK